MWANFVIQKVKEPNSWMYHVTLVADNDRCNPTCISKGPATQNAVCRSGLRSLSAAECYILSRLF